MSLLNWLEDGGLKMEVKIGGHLYPRQSSRFLHPTSILTTLAKLYT
ncbi:MULTISPECIES: hypothetical protein [Chryseobacterium]|nr:MULTISPECIES: hypothetical protein [Chryseobacterium]MEC5173488.1 hypothetical protein [Chryseobacterium nepalense]